MTTSKKPTKSIAAVDDYEGYDLVDVETIDYTQGQINEARQKKWAFKIGDTVYRFKPIDDWSFETEEAYNLNQFRLWASGALEDPAQLPDLVKEKGTWWAAIAVHLNREVATSRGEGDSSSGS